MSVVRRNSNVLELPRGLTVAGASTKSRVTRRPKHEFHITQYPYELTPFMLAPVLAGETLENMLWQCRAVSTTLKNKLIGHHLEHYFFYVKLRDLADKDDIVAMLMDTGASSVNTSSGSTYHFTTSGAPAWLEMCTTVVVREYFRDEGDTGSHVGSVTGLPLVMWDNKNSILDSLTNDADIETGAIDDAQPFPEHEQAYNAWLFARQMQLTEMDFEDYLGTFGVRLPVEETPGKPELIRFTKNWTYPTNTVDGDGTINTQASWSITERADKKRFIREPGFIVGYTVHRPKVYVGGRSQTACSLLDNALFWLPATMKEQAYSSLRQFQGNDADSPWSDASTPTGGQLDSDLKYWVDVRDIFTHGDFFTNMTLDSNINAVNPSNVLDFHGKKYPSSAGLQSLGVSALTVESDGVVYPAIKGTQLDMT